MTACQRSPRGMVGRVYHWRGGRWKVLVRWAPPSRDVLTAVCDECGHILLLGGLDTIPFCKCGGHPFEYQPSRRVVNAAPRNVLIENVETGERVVRPFRGLRCYVLQVDSLEAAA